MEFPPDVSVERPLSAGEGPGLIFVTLPLAFGNMTGGTILGLMFFLLLTFAP